MDVALSSLPDGLTAHLACFIQRKKSKIDKLAALKDWTHIDGLAPSTYSGVQDDILCVGFLFSIHVQLLILSSPQEGYPYDVPKVLPSSGNQCTHGQFDPETEGRGVSRSPLPFILDQEEARCCRY